MIFLFGSQRISLSLSVFLSFCRVPERGGGCSPHGSVHHSLQSDSAGGESSYRWDPSAGVSKHFTQCHTILPRVSSRRHQSEPYLERPAPLGWENNQISLNVQSKTDVTSAHNQSLCPRQGENEEALSALIKLWLVWTAARRGPGLYHHHF